MLWITLFGTFEFKKSYYNLNLKHKIAAYGLFEFKISYPQKCFLNLNEESGWVFIFKISGLLIWYFEFKILGRF